MAANTVPIFTEAPILGKAIWTNSSTANTRSDGNGTVGTSMVLLVSGGADGTFVNRVRFMPTATTAATATTATVIRVYLSTVNSGGTTSADTVLVAELGAPSQTAASATVAVTPLDLSLGFGIPSGWYLLVSMHHVAAANTVWEMTAYGGDY